MGTTRNPAPLKENSQDILQPSPVILPLGCGRMAAVALIKGPGFLYALKAMLSHAEPAYVIENEENVMKCYKGQKGRS